MDAAVVVDVLIPTFRRKTALAMTLTSLLGQTLRRFRITIADQTPASERYLDDSELRTIIGALRWHGHEVRLFTREQRRGIAEQRAFLFSASSAPYVHYLDDDVVLAPEVLERMLGVIREERCGFVGAAAAGFDYLDDVRAGDHVLFEPWFGRVESEVFASGAPPYARHRVNSAATPLHLERIHAPHGRTVRYKVAWVGGANVLYNREKLAAVGAFDFWNRLPPEHAGEDALVQYLLLERYGGCAVLPCGTYHQCLPTTIPDRNVEATTLHASLRRELLDAGR